MMYYIDNSDDCVTYLKNLGIFTYYITRFLKYTIIIMSMAFITMITGGVALFWWMMIFDGLKKTITINTSIYKDFVLFNKDKISSIGIKNKVREKNFYLAIMFSIFFAILLLILVNQHTLIDILGFSLIMGFFMFLVYIQFYYNLKIKNYVVEKENSSSIQVTNIK